MDPGGVPDRLGTGRWILWTRRGPAGPQPGVVPHGPDLRALHRALVLRADLVAVDDLPFPRRTRDWRRMGGGVDTAVRDVAKEVAPLDRRRAPDGCESRNPPCLPDGNFAEGPRAQICFPRRNH